jgi:hypothetical protein
MTALPMQVMRVCLAVLEIYAITMHSLKLMVVVNALLMAQRAEIVMIEI